MRKLRSFFRREDGAFAIEYAMTFPLFFVTVYGFFEIALFSFSSSSLQRSLEETVFNLRTGHAYKLIAEGEDPRDFLERSICAGVFIPNCAETIKISVQKYDINYNVYEDSGETGKVDLGASSIVMRVQADMAMPSYFTLGPAIKYFGYKPIFGSEEIRVGSGLTFMTEPY